MRGGMKSAKNFIKLGIFGLLVLVGIVVVWAIARWLIFNGRVAPIFTVVEALS